MNSIASGLQEHWKKRHLVPKGVWLVLFAYSLVAFGSPMPPKITWLEIVMGGGLLLGGGMLAGTLTREIRQHGSAKWCAGLTVILFLLPLCVGLIRGNALPDIVRDVFPLAFLLAIPFLLVYSASIGNRPILRTIMATALVFVGIATAVTFLVGMHDLAGSADRMVKMTRAGFGQIESPSPGVSATVASPAPPAPPGATKAYYDKMRIYFLKLYDPAMLFAAIFLSAWGIVLMVKSWRGWLPGMFLAGSGVLIAYGFMILGLRAYTALFVLALLSIGLTQFRERGFYIRLVPFIVLGCIMVWPQIWSVLHMLWIKQQIVGTNGKAAEWLAVFNTVFSSPQTTLLGIGWGGTFNNPILHETTRFTHSALSFYVLKSGVLGLIVLLSIIVILLFHGRRFGDSRAWTTSRQILLASCLPPLMIGVLFEPTYKMLSFGVILALFILVLPSRKKSIR